MLTDCTGLLLTAYLLLRKVASKRLVAINGYFKYICIIHCNTFSGFTRYSRRLIDVKGVIFNGDIFKVFLICRQIYAMKTSEFRSAAHYNNVIYSLIGHVIERLGGSSTEVTWEQLIVKLVLSRLNMTETSFYHERDQPEQFSKQYFHQYADNKTTSHLFNHLLIRSSQASYWVWSITCSIIHYSGQCQIANYMYVHLSA